jgi:MFS family permease
VIRRSSAEPLFTVPFFRLWIFTLITFFSAFQLFPTVPFRILELGGTKTQAGLFLALYTYACAFSAPVTGSFADAIGRKRLLMVASLAFIAFSMTYAVIGSFWLLLPFACLHGVFWSAILSSGAAILTDITPDSRRTEGLAYWGMASTGATAIAPLVGLVVYRRYGWMALCIEMALLSAVMFFLASQVKNDVPHERHPFPAISEVFDWRVMTAAMTLFVISFGYGGITSYVAMLSMDRHIEPRSLFFTVYAVTILVTRIFTSPIGDRFGVKVLLFPSLLLIPVSHLLLAWGTTKATLVVAGIVFGTGFGGAYPAFVAFVMNHSDARRRAATFGSILWAFDTGIGTGSWVIGYVVDHHGYVTAFTIAAILSAFSIPIFLATSRLLKRA